MLCSQPSPTTPATGAAGADSDRSGTTFRPRFTRALAAHASALPLKHRASAVPRSSSDLAAAFMEGSSGVLTAPITASAIYGILRSCAAGSQREMTSRTHAATRRPSPSPCRSSGDDSAHRCPDARARDRDRRGRDLPPPCPACGPRRWAIRWAKPRRTGPYQAQPGAPAYPAIWPRFAGISALEEAANAMLHTREVAGSKPAAPIKRLLVTY